jgi:SAM-dependent methyltransferase
VTETFDASWLELREPVDHRSRSAELLTSLRAWWDGRSSCDVLDLGCGTGSNLRYLAPHFPDTVRWTLIDRDAALLSRLKTPGAASTLRAICRDLATWDFAEVDRGQLVTASALLDLVSESWLAALVDACVGARSAALFALTYDGRIEWSNADRDDALVTDAVNAHQRRDKGFGPALGPAASAVAERLFRARGYEVRVRPSDWVLGTADAALADALIEGWAGAAAEERPEHAERARAWAARRAGGHAAVSTQITLRVGHQDLLALPPDR